MLKKFINLLGGNIIELDAKSVKSPGELSNVAPEAKGIVTATYACKLKFLF